MLVTTGYFDSQVQYWEPAKWVAKLRDLKTDNNLLFLNTNMDAGHGGASGRFDALKETAKEFNLPYNEYKTMSKAIIEHFKHLGVLGQKPELA